MKTFSMGNLQVVFPIQNKHKTDDKVGKEKVTRKHLREKNSLLQI